MSRSGRYEAKSELDGFETLNEKLSQDLRRHIKLLGSHPFLSTQWCDMAEVLGRIAKVSAMEAKLPKRNQTQTLWEGEENALRYIVEDGKINVCLRTLVEYKTCERELRRAQTPPTPEQLAKMEQFERGMGLMLRQAWEHPEAVQTTDVALLLQHVRETLEEATPDRLKELAAGPGGLDSKQESLVFFYLRGTFANMEDLGEERIMPLVRAERLFQHVVRALCAGERVLSREAVEAGARALALLCATEDFLTYKSKYVTSEEEISALFELRDGALAPLVEDDEERRKIRPLLDVIAQFQRTRK